MKRTTALFSAALLASGMAAGTAYAQSSSAQTQSSSAQTQSGVQQGQAQQNFSDKQLQNFASASQEIAGISQNYTQKLQNTQDADKQQEVRQEANDKMVKAVQDSGLQVEQFNQIGQAVQNDPKLMQKVQQMAQQKQ
ncbi:DUF4168 domain-containing protein [Phytohalomonas tamaricis]|uniref:DUF4168 domain-containing protein n=1 Tax=Phytohalomonas tamaricis TaxID=2081032 RepID=UPI000D0B399D|nr:DUF4168 domain-containing protein [Phytohalomonas tamaricis]